MLLLHSKSVDTNKHRASMGGGLFTLVIFHVELLDPLKLRVTPTRRMYCEMVLRTSCGENIEHRTGWRMHRTSGCVHSYRCETFHI